MTYTATCIDYVESADERAPLRSLRQTFPNYASALVWLDARANEYQRTDAGRLMTIVREDDGEVVERIDQPPCDDENAEEE